MVLSTQHSQRDSRQLSVGVEGLQPRGCKHLLYAGCWASDMMLFIARISCYRYAPAGEHGREQRRFRLIRSETTQPSFVERIMPMRLLSRRGTHLAMNR